MAFKLSDLTGFFGSDESRGEEALRTISLTPFMGMQNFLPPALRYGPTPATGAVAGAGASGGWKKGAGTQANLMRLFQGFKGGGAAPTGAATGGYPGVGAGLEAGVQGIMQLLQNPGGMNPNIASAIAPLLAMESENIARNFRGIRSEQQGAAARTNQPVSLKGALDAALKVAQDRAQRDTRRGAMVESEQLRRQDLGQTYAILDAINQYLSSQRGQAVQGLAGFVGEGRRETAAEQAGFANMLQMITGAG
jgi:hypothetical protein